MNGLSPEEVERRLERKEAKRLLALGENWEVGAGAPGESSITFSDTPWVPPAWKRRRKHRTRSLAESTSHSSPSVGWYSKFSGLGPPPPLSDSLAANSFPPSLSPLISLRAGGS